MSTSIFYDPPIQCRRLFAGQVKVVDGIQFWNKITKIVYSRIHSEDNNLNFEVNDSTKEVNFYTNQITFHDHGGTQLGYLDSSGVIRGLTVDGHATDLDIETLETAVNLKANTTDVNTAMALKADKTAVDTAFALKADRRDLDDCRRDFNDLRRKVVRLCERCSVDISSRNKTHLLCRKCWGILHNDESEY